MGRATLALRDDGDGVKFFSTLSSTLLYPMSVMRHNFWAIAKIVLEMELSRILIISIVPDGGGRGWRVAGLVLVGLGLRLHAGRAESSSAAGTGRLVFLLLLTAGTCPAVPGASGSGYLRGAVEPGRPGGGSEEGSCQPRHIKGI